MSTEAKACCARPRAAARGFSGSGLGLALALGTALLPKCPLCLAADVAIWSGLSLSFGAASVLRTGLIALCVGVLALLAAAQTYRVIARAGAHREAAECPRHSTRESDNAPR